MKDSCFFISSEASVRFLLKEYQLPLYFLLMCNLSDACFAMKLPLCNYCVLFVLIFSRPAVGLAFQSFFSGYFPVSGPQVHSCLTIRVSVVASQIKQKKYDGKCCEPFAQDTVLLEKHHRLKWHGQCREPWRQTTAFIKFGNTAYSAISMQSFCGALKTSVALMYLLIYDLTRCAVRSRY